MAVLLKSRATEPMCCGVHTMVVGIFAQLVHQHRSNVRPELTTQLLDSLQNWIALLAKLVRHTQC
eukprot:COSAG05_NODE_3549_length_1996_cov_11.092601_1_plen_65_part_00